MARYRLLSFDGGGIRGFISSSVLASLDADTGGTLMRHVDGVCGTSTGGIISIGLAAGMSPEDLRVLYRDNADDIFTENHFYTMMQSDPDSVVDLLKATGSGLVRKSGILGRLNEMIDGGTATDEVETTTLRDLKLLLITKYTSEGLRELLGKKLGTKTLADAQVDVAVNTSRLWNTNVDPVRWTASTPNSLTPGHYKDVSLVDLCCATGAAPVFFPPHEIGSLGFFADGGLFANNPVMNAVEVLRSAGRIESLDDLEIISLGTGLSPEGLPTETMDDPLWWGGARWLWPKERKDRPAVPLMSALTDLTSSSTEDIAQGVFQDKIVRIQPVLEEAIVLDDHSPDAYKEMTKAIKEAKASTAYKDALTMIKNWGAGA